MSFYRWSQWIYMCKYLSRECLSVFLSPLFLSPQTLLMWSWFNQLTGLSCSLSLRVHRLFSLPLLQLCYSDNCCLSSLRLTSICFNFTRNDICIRWAIDLLVLHVPLDRSQSHHIFVFPFDSITRSIFLSSSVYTHSNSYHQSILSLSGCVCVHLPLLIFHQMSHPINTLDKQREGEFIHFASSNSFNVSFLWPSCNSICLSHSSLLFTFLLSRMSCHTSSMRHCPTVHLNNWYGFSRERERDTFLPSNLCPSNIPPKSHRKCAVACRAIFSCTDLSICENIALCRLI